jgi:hypothetical protein
MLCGWWLSGFDPAKIASTIVKATDALSARTLAVTDRSSAWSKLRAMLPCLNVQEITVGFTMC